MCEEEEMKKGTKFLLKVITKEILLQKLRFTSASSHGSTHEFG